ncbi:MAG: hypothetical protein AVDCRST_MAG41-1005, partial [uncultured Corynebacteriales bacterium]
SRPPPPPWPSWPSCRSASTSPGTTPCTAASPTPSPASTGS